MPPIASQRGIKYIPGRNSKLALLGFSFEATRPGEKKGDSAFGVQPPRLDRGRSNDLHHTF